MHGVDLVGFEGLVQQRRADGGIDAAADEQQHFVGADEAPDLLDAAHFPPLHGETPRDAGYVDEEILHHRQPVDAQIHFRVKLTTVKTLFTGVGGAGKLKDKRDKQEVTNIAIEGGKDGSRRIREVRNWKVERTKSMTHLFFIGDSSDDVARFGDDAKAISNWKR